MRSPFFNKDLFQSKCASSAVCSKKKRSILAAENAISTGGFRVKQKQVTKIEVAHKISKSKLVYNFVVR